MLFKMMLIILTVRRLKVMCVEPVSLLDVVDVCLSSSLLDVDVLLLSIAAKAAVV